MLHRAKQNSHCYITHNPQRLSESKIYIPHKSSHYPYFIPPLPIRPFKIEKKKHNTGDEHKNANKLQHVSFALSLHTTVFIVFVSPTPLPLLESLSLTTFNTQKELPWSLTFNTLSVNHSVAFFLPVLSIFLSPRRWDRFLSSIALRQPAYTLPPWLAEFIKRTR